MKRVVLAALLGALLAGCGGQIYLHDEIKAKLAAEAKDQYDAGAIQTTVKTARENFDTLLSAAKVASQSTSDALRTQIVQSAIYQDQSIRQFLHWQLGLTTLVDIGANDWYSFELLRTALDTHAEAWKKLNNSDGAARAAAGRSLPCYTLDLSSTVPSDYLRGQFVQAKIAPINEKIDAIDEKLKELDAANANEADEVKRLQNDKVVLNKNIEKLTTRFEAAYEGQVTNCRAYATPLANLHSAFVQKVAQSKINGFTGSVCEADGSVSLTARRQLQDKELSAVNAICGILKPTAETLCNARQAGGISAIRNTCKIIQVSSTARDQFLAILPQLNALAKANRAYAKKARIIKKRERGWEAVSKTIGENAEKVKTALKGIEKIGGILGTEIVSSERVAAFDTLINAYLTGKIDEQKAGSPRFIRAAKVISLIKSLETLAKRIEAQEAEYDLSKILLRRRVEAARAGYARANVTHLEREIALRTAKLATVQAQFASLVATKEALLNISARAAGNKNVCGPLQLDNNFNLIDPVPTDFRKRHETTMLYGPPAGTADLLQVDMAVLRDAKGDTCIRKNLVFAVANIATLRSVPEAQADIIEVELAVLDAERTLSQKRANVEMWDAMVQVPLSQIAAYHAGGIKSAELADIIVKIAGLTGIIIKLD